MTSLSSVLLAGLSAMRASQAGMGIASQNIANANTPGYVRTELTLAPATSFGSTAGVAVADISRAADRFLATASYIAEASRGSSAARADILARAQASFGDPNGASSMFATLDRFWSAMTTVGVDPASTLRRDDAISALQATFSEARRVGEGLQTMISEADQRIADAVSAAQGLINRISSLNEEIRLTKRSGADSSAGENAQSALIDELSAIIDIRVSPQSEGGVHVRTSGGALLVGVGAATLSYSPNSAPFATHGVITFNQELGTASNIEPFLVGGQLKGLLEARDRDLPALAEALGGFSGALADALNEVHNENASTPAVSSLVGRQTGLLGTDALNFTGEAILGVVDADGVLAQRLTIDFDAGSITAEPPGGGPFLFPSAPGDPATIAEFTAALNSALGGAVPSASANFTGGVLSINVTSSGGVLVQQDADDPSARAGRGFSHFFGLNDLVSRPTPLFYENGLTPSVDLHGLNSGGEISFEIRDAAGRFIAERTVTISGALAGAGSTWNDLRTALMASGTGIGGFGTISFDSTTGRMSLSSAAGFDVRLVSDSTIRGTTGVSATALHGMTPASTAGRAIEVEVNALVAAEPSRLAVGRPDLTAALGDRIIEAGDNRGAAALTAARDSTRTFPAAGLFSGQSTTIAIYAARLGGEAGRLASDAKRAADGALAVSTAAVDRRAQVEGVSLDDELLRMTTYQNAYAAAARVIQAASEMLDVLLAIGLR